MNTKRNVLLYKIWRISLLILLGHTYTVRCTAPCEFPHGNCKTSGPYYYPPPPPPTPVLTLQHNPDPHHHYHHHPQPQQQQKQVYVPSLPGKQPRCAKRGWTFCEKIEKYPTDLITTLVSKSNYNFKTLFADESYGAKRELYNANSKMRPNQGSSYGAPSPPEVFASVNVNTDAFNQSSLHGGYPARQYPLDEPAIHIVDPVLYASFSNLNGYNPDEWWKRNERSDNSKTGQHKRKRRQTSQSATPAGTELCPTKSQFIMPRAALNSRGEWRYVVNVEQGSEKYTQLVRSETCLTTECNGICSIPNGYTSRCQQKYVQKRLVALEDNGNNLYTDVFWFPHCCVCQIAPDIR